MKNDDALDLFDRKWAAAWADRPFRNRLLLAVSGMLVVLALLPPFFQLIEKRGGRHINDPLLDLLGPADMSIPIFTCIWGVVIIGIQRAVKSPVFLYQFVGSYILLTLLRMATIYITRLDPPAGLLPLVDPIANRFYGKSFITRDLFFSGHTATLFLFAFNFRRSWERNLAFFCASAVGILVLVQHIHYTIDVLAAPILTYFCYFGAKKMMFD